MHLKFKRKLLFPLEGTLFIFILITGCFKDIPNKIVIYENDFETSDTSNLEIRGPLGKIDSLKIFKFNNTQVYGRFRDNDVILRLYQLPVHNIIKIEFDLYLHDNWQGNFIPAGSSMPDIWQLKIDNNPIIQTSFSNDSHDQSYPDNYPTYNIPFSNAWGKLPGVCSKISQKDGTSYYKLEYITSHQGGLQLEFQDVPFGGGNQFVKSWSIDNLRLTTSLTE